MPRPLKIGVQLPEVEYVYTWAQLKEMAQTAEAIGLDSIWVGDHLMYRYARQDAPPRGPYEAWSTMAALAAVTDRVEIGPLVASTGFNNPAMIAKRSATIDQISNGRFILGLGSGWHEPEYRGFGFPFDRRVARFKESFEIITTLLDTGECNYAGEFFTLEGGLLFPKPVRDIPIMIGSNGERMLSIALPRATMWNSWFDGWDNNTAGLKRLLGEIDRACELAGKDPSTLIRTICPLVRMPGGSGRLSDYTEAGAVTPLDGANAGAMADELRAYAELGVGHVQFVLDPITNDSIRQLAPILELLDD
jgi:alkanesulfonate monooxygenase SsuD/methylene tetrahydromethanopterin reductase-like flavin-dependent oxidoreductase (luciferase family)